MLILQPKGTIHPPPSLKNPGSALPLYLKHFFRELAGVWEKLRHVSPGKAVTDKGLKITNKFSKFLKIKNKLYPFSSNGYNWKLRSPISFFFLFTQNRTKNCHSFRDCYAV